MVLDTAVQRQLTGPEAELALLQQAERYMPGGVNTSLRRIQPPLVIASAQGASFTDIQGQRYIDYHAAFGPIILGHNYPAVVRRVNEILQREDLCGVGVAPLEVAVAQKIVECIPSAEKTLLCNSGSEATYHAIRVARAYTGRPKLIKFQGCYHGWHDYACRNIISAPERVGQRDPASAGMLDAAIDATLVCRFNDLNDVAETLQRHHGEVAAIILEPIPHNIGCVLPAQGFLEGLRSMASQAGSLLIFDEVITGFRHGLGGFQQICGVLPDLTTVGKSIANGFPMAAVCGRAEILDHFATRQGGDVFFAGTFNGHPVNCAAALATLELLQDGQVHRHLFALGERMRQGLRGILQRLKIPAIVAGYGSIFLTYFMPERPIRDYSDLLHNDAERFIRYRRELMKRGIFKIPLNLKRCQISFSHTVEDIDRTLQASEDVLKQLD